MIRSSSPFLLIILFILIPYLSPSRTDNPSPCTLSSASPLSKPIPPPVLHRTDVSVHPSSDSASSSSSTTSSSISSTSISISRYLLTGCLPGQGLNETGDCSPCKPGYFNNLPGSSCIPCPSGSYTSFANSTECQLCNATTYSAAGSVNCTRTCPPGTGVPYPGSSACDICPVNTYNNGSSSFCTYCPTSFFAYNTSSISRSQCLPCPSGHVCPYQTLAPQLCNAGSIPNPSKDTCILCSSGFYNPISGGQSCLPCPLTNVSFFPGADRCIQCNPGSVPNADRNQCLPCPKGFFSAQSGNTVCLACPIDSVSISTGQSFCSPCTTGAVPNTNQDACVNCLPGYYKANTTTCLPCNRNQISPGGTDTCSFCPPGYEANSLRTQCQPCTGGYFSTGNGTFCTSCRPGERSEFTLASTSCLACPAGQYSSSPGQASCSFCGIGRTSTENSTECRMCDPGSFAADVGSPNCTLCLPGSWNNEFGRSACKICPKGTYNPSFGSKISSACLLCEKSFYSLENASFCTSCPPDTFSGTGADSCITCPAGYVEQSGTFALPPPPSILSNDLILLGPNNTVCTACPVNSFSPFPHATECKPCPNNTFSTEGSLSCSATCLAGFTFVTLNAVNTLNTNRSLVVPTGTTKDFSCRPCASGTFQPITFDPKTYSSLFLEKVQCQKCDRGYIAAGTGLSACTPCGWINGSNPSFPSSLPLLSSFSRSSCTDTCASNEYVEFITPPRTTGLYGRIPGSCEICPRNNWCVNGTFRIACATCDIGNQCQEHYAGDYCLQCAPQHFRFNGVCVSCPKVPARLIAFVVLFVVLVIIVGAVGATSRRGLTSLLSNRLRLFNAIQDASQVNYPYPYSFLFYFPWLLGLRLDATDMECYVSVTYTDKWILSTFFPLIALCAFAIALVIPTLPCIKRVCCPFRNSSRCFCRWDNTGRIPIFLLTALSGGVIPFMASQGLKGFVCLQTETTSSASSSSGNPSVEPYSLIDPSITCNSNAGFTIRAIGGFAVAFAILLYFIGGTLDLCYFRTSLVARKDRIEAKELWFDGFFGLLIVMVGQITRIISNNPSGSVIGLSVILAAVFVSFLLWLILYYDKKDSFQNSHGWSILSVSRIISFVTDSLVVFTGIILNVINGTTRVTGEETNIVIGWMLLFVSIPSFYIVFIAIGQVIESTLHDACCNSRSNGGPFDDPETSGTKSSYRSSPSSSYPSLRCFGYRERTPKRPLLVVIGLSVLAGICAFISSFIVQHLWLNSLKCENRQALYVEKYNLAPDTGSSQTMLMAAAAGGHTDAVMNLCGDIHAVDKYGKTALMYASQNGRYEIAWTLTSAPFNVDVDAQDKAGRTALVWAAISGDLTTVQILRAQGADISIVDNEGRSAVWYAGELASVNTDPVRFSKYVSIVTELSVDSQANVSEVLLATAGTGLVNEFTNAILRGANVDYIGTLGWRASTKASKYGSADMLSLLCTKGANLMAPVQSPVTSSIVNLYTESSRSYNSYEDIVPVTDESIQRTVLSNAFYEASTNLLSTGGTIGTSANENYVTVRWPTYPVHSFSPLMLASYYKHASSIEALCTCGLTAPSQFSYVTEVSRTVTDQKWNALFLATIADCGNCIRPLVSLCGSNVNGKDNEGNTPLFIAAMEGNVNAISGLCTNNANPDLRLGAQGSTVLTRLSEIGDKLETFSAIVGRMVGAPCNGNINRAEESTGDSPLIKASIHLQIESMKILYQYQAFTTSTDRNGRTALFRVTLLNAAENPKVLDGIATLCIALSADPNVWDNDGAVPLVAASERGDYPMVQELLTTCRADRNIHERRNGQFHDTSLMKAVRRCANSDTLENGYRLIRLLCSTATAAERNFMSLGTNSDGYTAWTLAALYGYVPNVINVIDDACKLNPLGKDKTIYTDTALTIAARYNRKTMSEHLCRFHLQLGHNPTLIRDVNGSNPLLIASWYGNLDTIKVANTVCVIDIDTPMVGTLHTPIMRAIINFQYEAVRLLLTLRANVYVREVRGYDSLIIAVRNGNLPSVYDLCNDQNRYPHKPCGSPVRKYIEYSNLYYLCKCSTDSHINCKDCEGNFYRKDRIGTYKSVVNDKNDAVMNAITHVCADGGDNYACQEIKNYLSDRLNYESCNGYCQNVRIETCFSPYAKVKVKVRTVTATMNPRENDKILGSPYQELFLHELRPGDQVLSLDRTNGSLRWSTFYIDTHFHTETLTKFLRIDALVSGKVSGVLSRSLKLTEEHYLPVYQGGCGAYRDRSGSREEGDDIDHVTFPAKRVRIGDGILLLSDSHDIVCGTVTNVSVIIEKGHSSPYTLEGTIIVDGVAASVYANLDKHKGESLGVVIRTAHSDAWLARYLWETMGISSYVAAVYYGTIRSWIYGIVSITILLSYTMGWYQRK